MPKRKVASSSPKAKSPKRAAAVEDDSGAESDSLERKRTRASSKKSTPTKAAPKKATPKKASKKAAVNADSGGTSSDDGSDDGSEDAPAAKKHKKENAQAAISAPLLHTDFSAPAKSDGQLKIVSWNVAGFASILKKGFEAYIKEEDPDIICLQETKIAEEAVSAALLPGYKRYVYPSSENKGQHGVSVFTKVEPIKVTKGIGQAEHDNQGRVLTLEFAKFHLVASYIPNSGQKLVRLGYRKKWDVAFLAYLKKLEASKPLVWCGDLNVAHQEIDLTNPKPNRNKTPGFADEEREGFQRVLDSGFIDVWRHQNPNTTNLWTFWSYRGGSRLRNVGWRLDYFVVSQALLTACGDCFVRTHVQGSDHAPLGLLLRAN